MLREIIATERAPAAVGPYSQAVRVGNLVFTAGQIGIDPMLGQLRTGIAAQTRQVLDNISAVLKAAGLSTRDVVKTTVFMADMNDFAAVNAVYGEFFTGVPPARSAVQAARLPKDAFVEIEAVAYLG